MSPKGSQLLLGQPRKSVKKHLIVGVSLSDFRPVMLYILTHRPGTTCLALEDGEMVFEAVFHRAMDCIVPIGTPTTVAGLLFAALAARSGVCKNPRPEKIWNHKAP
ncbi:protein of unknown function [Thauera humireducens]|nr:protein of unknown function [Thauera humireducens]